MREGARPLWLWSAYTPTPPWWLTPPSPASAPPPPTCLTPLSTPQLRKQAAMQKNTIPQFYSKTPHFHACSRLDGIAHCLFHHSCDRQGLQLTSARIFSVSDTPCHPDNGCVCVRTCVCVCVCVWCFWQPRSEMSFSPAVPLLLSLTLILLTFQSYPPDTIKKACHIESSQRTDQRRESCHYWP